MKMTRAVKAEVAKATMVSESCVLHDLTTSSSACSACLELFSRCESVKPDRMISERLL